MKRLILSAALVAGLAGAVSGEAHALGPVPRDAGASASLATPVMSDARARRLYMMQQIQRQQMYGRGGPYGRAPGYGGYGQPAPYGYGRPSHRGYYGGAPRRGYYGY